MWNIKENKFGFISINDKSYEKDLILTPIKIIENWHREKGHLLQLTDLDHIKEDLFTYRYILIGCGYSKKMKLSSDIIDWFDKNDILYFHGRTDDIIQLYQDSIKRSNNLIVLLHLSC